MRRSFDRFVALVARLITRGLYRSVEIVGFDDLPEGPRLIVANHFNGFVDPVVLAGALGRLPRFIAKATLWKTPGVPILLKVVGVLPVARAVDGGGDNSKTFDAVVAQLHHGHAVAIFPEGTTHDEQRLAPVRTGAARLALDAASDGVAGMHIVPVGITFEDKVALRSRVVIQAGPIIDPTSAPYCTPDGTPAGSDDHEVVNALTTDIRTALASVSPDFDSLLDAVELRAAADLLLRTEGAAPLQETSLAEREELAAELEDLPLADRERIGADVAEYHLLLGAVGARDDYLVPAVDPRALVWRFVLTALLVAVLAPFAIVGVMVNIVPVLLVAAAGAVAKAPVSKGTNRVLAGVVVFPATWALVAIWDFGGGWISTALSETTSPLTPFLEAMFGSRGGWGSSLVVFLLLPALGLLAVWLLEQIIRVFRTYGAVKTTFSRRGQLAELLGRRAQVVASIEAARS